MTGYLIRGETQIMPQTIKLAQFDPALGLPSTYLADGGNFLKKDGSVTLTGSLNIGGNKLTNIAPGTNPTDAVSLTQLQAYVNGFRLHFFRAISVNNLTTLSGYQTLDGVTLADGDYAFLIAQTNQAQNGPWVVHAGAWTRPPEWASGGVEPPGQYFIADPDGTTYKNTKWFLTNTSNVTVDTTAATFQQDLSGVSYINGAGLSLVGNTFSVARGVGIGLDGSNNIIVTSDPNRMLQSISAGVGIKDGSPGQILMANSAGNASYQTVSGDVTISNAGVLTVNHTAGSGFLKYTDIIRNEVPGGTPNGSLTQFTLANVPQPTTLNVYKNGTLAKPGTGNDYTLSGSTITFTLAPYNTDQLLVDYIK